MNAINNEPRTFQEIRARLDEIVTEVREKDLSLEKSLDLYEEAIRLGNRCSDLVDKAEYSDEELEELKALASPEEGAADDGASDLEGGADDETDDAAADGKLQSADQACADAIQAADGDTEDTLPADDGQGDIEFLAEDTVFRSRTDAGR